MPRIVYALLANDQVPRGGHKMIVRHVETLRDLGFDAICQLGHETRPPRFFEHGLRLQSGAAFRDDDVVVLPDDAPIALERMAATSQRVVVFSQGIESLGAVAFRALEAFSSADQPDFIAIAPHHAALIRRAYPAAHVETVPCFADERRFKPAVKTGNIAMMPWKRMGEANAIRGFFKKLHPRHDTIRWTTILNAHEDQVAEALGKASLFLSLSRGESVGLTPLEAMASGCLCAGFLGVGGHAFATPGNGFWAADDDCVAAADQLAEAADIVLRGGPDLQRRLEAGRETARQWGYANFRVALEEAWMRLSPASRISARALPT